MKKRLLALLLCLVMVLSLVPVALADGANDDTAQITVHFDLHGGTGTETKQSETSSETGKQIVGTIAEPTRAGYTFAGWYTDSGYKGEWNIWWELPDQADFWLHAKWTPNAYTIKFDDNGGTGTMADITTSDEYTLLSKNTFKWNGHTFEGWATSSSATNKKFSDMCAVFVGDLAEAAGDDNVVTLYAVWKENETPSTASYTITYATDETTSATKVEKQTDTNGKLKIMDWPSEWTVPEGKKFDNKWIAGTEVYNVGTTYTFKRDTKLTPVLVDKNASAADSKSTVQYYCSSCSAWETMSFTRKLSDTIYNSITIDPNGGAVASYVADSKTVSIAAADQTKRNTVFFGATVESGTAKEVKAIKLLSPTRTGYTFTGWSFDTKTNTFTAQWTANHASYCDVYYYDYDDGKYEYAEFAYGTSIVIDPNGGTAKLNGTSFKTSQSFSIYRDYTLTDASRTGYTFYGWVLARSGNTWYFTAMWTRKSTVPYMLNGDDHYAYITGYPGGTFKPTACITRAEAATIFYRLLTDSTRSLYSTSYNTFKDVPANAWYATAVSTMAKLGIVNGSNGYFRPNDYITRAEIAAMVARCDGSYYSSSYSSFSDTVGHWASSYIQRAYELGWINGYGKTYKPDQYINRAETVAILNRVLGRAPQYTTDLVKYMNTFTDVSVTAWYYLDVQEAANSHAYTRKTNGYEYWNKLIADPSWMK